MAIALPTTVDAPRAATAERHGIEFRRVLDAIGDLGMDPTGGESVDEEIAAAGDGALIQFPNGVYQFDTESRGRFLDGETRGFEGTGDDVTFLAPADHHGLLLDGIGMEGAYINNVVIDQTAPNTCSGIRLCGNRVAVRDVVAHGGGDCRDSNTPVLFVSTASPEEASPVEKGTVADGAGVRSGPGRRELLVENLGWTPSPSDRIHDSGMPGTDTLTIEGTGVATNYEITVDGQIEGELYPSRYSLSGSNSEGTIESDTISYSIDGTITDFRLTGAANVFLNNDQINPDALGVAPHHRLVFDAIGGATPYAFSVGHRYPNYSVNATPESREQISDSVSEGVDVYRFDGSASSSPRKGGQHYRSITVGGLNRHDISDYG